MEERITGFKRIESELLALDAIPQLGALPPFPYETLQGTLRAQFDLPSLTLKEEWSRWMPHNEALDGLGDPLTHLTLACPPFEGELFFSLPTTSLQHLMHTLLGGDPYAAALYDSDLREGFANFLCAEVLKACQETGYPITPVIASKKALPEGPLFVRQIAIDGHHTRLLLTKTLCHSIRTHYEEAKVPLSPELAATLPISLSTEVGSAKLSGEEWRGLKEGDFIYLDTCTVSPTAQEGTTTLALQGQPLLEGEIGPEGVTITGV